MNLRTPNANEATGTYNRSKNVAPVSGICTRCVDGCRGNCEIFQATFRGREVLYPGPFGEITAGADKNYPVDYSHLNINGYAVGAFGLPAGVESGPDTAIFPNVDTDTEYMAGQGLERFAMVVPLQGGYANLRHFIQAVESSDKFLVVERVAIDRAKDGGVLLQMNITLATYFDASGLLDDGSS